MKFQGQFEFHVTVAASGPNELSSLSEWARRNGVSFLLIELARGTTVSQPMLTWRDSGRLTDHMQRLTEFRSRLTADGFPVVRMKVECDPFSDGVPITDADALRVRPDQYFEHHIKLLLSEKTDLSALTMIATSHSAHLSRNAFRVRNDGFCERFVTQRCRCVGRQTAQHRLAHLKEDIEKSGHSILEVEAEFVVSDSNESLDAGWLET